MTHVILEGKPKEAQIRRGKHKPKQPCQLISKDRERRKRGSEERERERAWEG